MATLQRIWRGCHGHPGALPLVLMALLGMVAGGWRGAGIMFGVYLPFFLIGAYERG